MPLVPGPPPTGNGLDGGAVLVRFSCRRGYAYGCIPSLPLYCETIRGRQPAEGGVSSDTRHAPVSKHPEKSLVQLPSEQQTQSIKTTSSLKSPAWASPPGESHGCAPSLCCCSMKTPRCRRTGHPLRRSGNWHNNRRCTSLLVVAEARLRILTKLVVAEEQLMIKVVAEKKSPHPHQTLR